MQKADSTDPAKYLPELQKISYDGATGQIEFDDKGDRKDAEMTIFTDEGRQGRAGRRHQGGQDDDVRRLMAAGGAPPAAPAAGTRPRPRHRRRHRRPMAPARRPRRAEEVSAHRSVTRNGAFGRRFFLRGVARRASARRARAACRTMPAHAADGRSDRARPPNSPTRRASRALDIFLQQLVNGLTLGSVYADRRARLHDGVRHHPAHQLRARRGGDDRRDGRVHGDHRAARPRTRACRRS